MWGRFKTGHVGWPRTDPYLSCFLLIEQVCFSSPAPRIAFQDVTMVEKTIQHGGDRGAVAEQFAPESTVGKRTGSARHADQYVRAA